MCLDVSAFVHRSKHDNTLHGKAGHCIHPGVRPGSAFPACMSTKLGARHHSTNGRHPKQLNRLQHACTRVFFVRETSSLAHTHTYPLLFQRLSPKPRDYMLDLVLGRKTMYLWLPWHALQHGKCHQVISIIRYVNISAKRTKATRDWSPASSVKLRTAHQAKA
jgi:hypothetical protein